MMLPVVEHARFFGLAVSFVNHAPLGFMKSQFRFGAHDIRPGAAMGKTWMHRVHAILDALQPITIL